MKIIYCLILLFFVQPTFAARRVKSTPATMYLNHIGPGNFCTAYFRLNLVNLADFAQTVRVSVKDIKVEQGLAIKSEADGDTYYSRWAKHPVFLTSRSRTFDFRDLERELTVPANGSAQTIFNVTCLVDNSVSSSSNPPSSTCQDNTHFVRGFTAPFPVERIVGTVIASFEMTTTGTNSDKGAILASYTIIQNVAGETQDLTRELNGGRPF